ncbi:MULTISPECIES: hypothetical protein [unclassified Devosia]|uniref:hypothetical protein n=1 Tax=unclassified Devosia TaxID=196773 RepID=UPI00145DD847|nr:MULTISPECIES: hypothetical protein [unclassified Devosia]MBJ6988783.1 hypothetical protein [Devosia sp. MC521]MBJ7579247.1 hypothetical protein [Devosia sp. MC532]QMW63082.1 hypothetical protein H4N61_01615 [Devosia sp. MC521]
MRTIAALRYAFAGWKLILRNKREGLEQFQLSAAGLFTAIVLFYAVVFLVVMLASMQMGVPTPESFIEIFFIQTIWLAALLIGVWSTRFAVSGPIWRPDIYVPGVYALIFYLFVGTVVTMISPALMPILWLGLAYMLYALGRVGAGFQRGVSAAFAILTVVLLVGVPQTLYMLAASTLSAV